MAAFSTRALTFAAPIFAALSFAAPALAAVIFAAPALAAPGENPRDWAGVKRAAAGQTVYWHAWGGSTAINDFIAWVGERVKSEADVTLVHVKLTDTAEAVSRVLAEKAAGRHRRGAVDLIWINGENFAAMKRQDLLFGPWAEDLPNRRYVSDEGRLVSHDFTIPVDGLESPWAKAQAVFIHDSARLPDPPTAMDALLDWAHDNPGRLTFPQPPDFLGSTFLKQVLLDLSDDPDVFLSPPDDDDAYRRLTASLWDYMEEITPLMWRRGRAYPQSGPQQIQLLGDGEIDIAISFSPGEASSAIANDELPPTVRTFVLDKGTLGNASFVAIPYNGASKAGAMIVADFLLSPKAQARMQDPSYVGMGTVLDMSKLARSDARRFDDIDLGPATLTPAQLGTGLPEPHPDWMERIEADWAARFGGGR